jgi:hypothetical protein
MRDYRTAKAASSVDMDRLIAYIQAQRDEGELLRWNVCIRQRVDRNLRLGDEDLGIPERVGRMNRSRISRTNSIGTLVDPAVAGSGRGDELIDLPPAIIEAANKRLAEEPGLKFGRILRSLRDKETGLLLIYPISPASIPDPIRDKRTALFPEGKAASMPTVVGLALVFPDSRSAATSEYYVGTAGPFEGD